VAEGEIKIISNEVLIPDLIRQVEDRVPTSIVRKSDGENVMLAYGVVSMVQRKHYYKKLYHYNAYPWQIRFQLFIRTQLIRAFQQADYLGISKPEHRHGLWSQEEEILSIFGLNEQPYCDMNFHMDFIKYPDRYHLVNPQTEKLVTRRHVGLITHRDLSDFFQHYHSEVIFQTEIPKRRSRVQVMTRKKFDRILDQITTHNENVDVWFVGAGIYAKPFCNHIKACGGIGIDMGSTLDSWANDYESRGHLRKFYKKHAQ